MDGMVCHQLSLKILSRKFALKAAKKSGKWCIICVALLFIIGWDILTLSPVQNLSTPGNENYYKLVQHVLTWEYLSLWVLLLMISYNGVKYVWPYVGYETILVTPQQRFIFHIPENEHTFQTLHLSLPPSSPSDPWSKLVLSPKRHITSTPISRPASAHDLSSPYTPTGSPFSSPYTPTGSPFSSFDASTPVTINSSSSPHFHMTHTGSFSMDHDSSSWFNTHLSSSQHTNVSPAYQSLGRSYGDQSVYSPELDTPLKSSFDLSHEKLELQAFLKEQAARERKEAWMMYRHQMGLSQAKNQDLLHYLSPFRPAEKSPSVSMSNDLLTSKNHMSVDQFCAAANISLERLESWIECLRLWLSQTIIARVVQEIMETNNSLRKMGSSEISIECSSLSTLRQISVTRHQQLPCLEQLIPFLDVNANQEYVVNRLKDLASSGCLGGYQWSGGGSFKGRTWDEHLPTDAALIFHVFSTYLDSRLLAHPRAADGKTFTKLYTSKTPDKINLSMFKDSMCICQTEVNPPVFKLIAYGTIYHVPKGRNNLFLTILLFLHFIKTKETCMLGPVHFGVTGINMMWIID